MAKKHMNNCSTSLVIREIQAKTTVRYEVACTRMTKVKKTE